MQHAASPPVKKVKAHHTMSWCHMDVSASLTVYSFVYNNTTTIIKNIKLIKYPASLFDKLVYDPALGCYYRDAVNDSNLALRYQMPQQEFQKQTDYSQKMLSDVNSQVVTVARNAHKSNMQPQLDQGDWQQCDNGYHSRETININSLTQVYGSILQSPYPSPNIVTLDALQTPLQVSTYPQTQPLRFGDEISMQYDYSFDQQVYSDGQYEQPPTPTSNSSRPSSPSLINQKPPVYTKWTEDEDQLLRAAISIYGPHKWSLIAAHVPNRTPMQCSTRWLGALNPTIHKGRWTPEEDAALKDAVSEYVDLTDSDGNPQPIPWNKIAARIPHRTGIQCQARWSEALDPRVRKGKWSPEEDEILKEGVRRFGRCWIRIAEMIDGRTQRQCRTRWVQIKNKQAKLERDASAAATTANGTSDDCGSSVTMISPPNSTPTTPTMGISAGSLVQSGDGELRQQQIPPPLDIPTYSSSSPTSNSTSSSNNSPTTINAPQLSAIGGNIGVATLKMDPQQNNAANLMIYNSPNNLIQNQYYMI
ncbi:9754_t:CDS:10 [Ambispora gerdemannii]|uniref:9754_t:CDS:1 n=1 Tax=Ambispora gerdemannii TaxID=144530 RepID=A0A9N8YT57_9GLOM|nr:9754_t:CDS:10 [Ambispora gerdemannii]